MKIDDPSGKGALGFTVDPDGDILDQLTLKPSVESVQPKQVPVATAVVNLDRF